MLAYVECGHAFTNDFGDIDEPFQVALINKLERLAVELRSSPARRELYAQFRTRLLEMPHSSDIGWGYGDLVHEIVADLEAAPGEYILQPETPEGMPLPKADRQDFSVLPGGFTSIIVSYDSGIR